MAHWSASPTSRSPSRSSLRGGTPPPPLGIWSGLPLIRCRDCGSFVEEYIPGLGGSITGNPSCCRWNETGAHGSCSFFKTQEEYEAILRDRGLLGPAATPEQGSGYPILIPEPVKDLKHEIVAAMEDLKHEMVAQKAIMKWFFMASCVLVLVFGIVVAMSVK